MFFNFLFARGNFRNLYLNKVLFSIWFVEFFYIGIVIQVFCCPFYEIKIIKKIKSNTFQLYTLPFIYLFI